ncbi:MAG TPA: hypothetical protein VIH06_14395 [Ilumatobacteraceae bacterium]
MEPTGMDRRRVLSGVGVAAGAIVASTVAMSSSAMADNGDNDGDNHDNNGNITGSWMVNRQSDNDPNDHSMSVLSFAAGNVMIIHDINPAGPPFTGTWARQSNHGFRATVWTGAAGEGPNGPPGPVLRVQLEGNVHKGMLSGTYHLTGFDATTNDVLFEDTGTFSGQRIAA